MIDYETTGKPVTLDFSIYKYCIHELNGKYQWRWMFKSPPESNGELGISPVFDTLDAAIEWGKSQPQNPKKTTWTPVSLDTQYECTTKRS